MSIAYLMCSSLSMFRFSWLLPMEFLALRPQGTGTLVGEAEWNGDRYVLRESAKVAELSSVILPGSVVRLRKAAVTRFLTAEAPVLRSSDIECVLQESEGVECHAQRLVCPHLSACGQCSFAQLKTSFSAQLIYDEFRRKLSACTPIDSIRILKPLHSPSSMWSQHDSRASRLWFVEGDESSLCVAPLKHDKKISPPLNTTDCGLLSVSTRRVVDTIRVWARDEHLTDKITHLDALSGRYGHQLFILCANGLRNAKRNTSLASTLMELIHRDQAIQTSIKVIIAGPQGNPIATPQAEESFCQSWATIYNPAGSPIRADYAMLPGDDSLAINLHHGADLVVTALSSVISNCFPSISTLVDYPSGGTLFSSSLGHALRCKTLTVDASDCHKTLRCWLSGQSNDATGAALSLSEYRECRNHVVCFHMLRGRSPRVPSKLIEGARGLIIICPSNDPGLKDSIEAMESSGFKLRQAGSVCHRPNAFSFLFILVFDR